MNKAFFIPRSRKARVFLAILALFLVGGVLMFLPERETAEPPALTLLQSDNRFEQFNRDDDNDGLKNWEETIFKTDPNNPDTDGDGIRDGKEAFNLNLPAQEPPPRDKTESNSNLTRELTELFGKNYIAPMALNPRIANQINTDQAAEEIVQDIFAKYSAQIETFNASDITAVEKGDVAQYRRDLASSVLKPFQNLPGMEVVIVAEAVKTEDYSNLAVLDPYIAAYNAVIQNLQTIPVPQQFKEFHIAFLNLAARQKKNVEHLRDIDKDIVGGLIAMNDYVLVRQEILNLTKKNPSIFYR